MIVRAKKIIITILPALCFLGLARIAQAYSIEQTGQPVKGDFVLEQAKQEIIIGKGERAVREISIINRTGVDRDFTVSVEDMKGNDKGDPTELLGEADGPYPLRNIITPEVNKFHLKHGERVRLPIAISIPHDAEPGGRYGSVLISSSPKNTLGEAGGANVISRLGALFFVRIKGDVNEGGYVEGFDVLTRGELLGWNEPTAFEIRYRNIGNVHSNPRGSILIANVAGVPVEEIEIKPFFSLPKALRYRSVEWNRPLLFGRYTATLTLDPGFGSGKDVKKISFWVIPMMQMWPYVGGLLVVLFLGWRFKLRRQHV